MPIVWVRRWRHILRNVNITQVKNEPNEFAFVAYNDDDNDVDDVDDLDVDVDVDDSVENEGPGVFSMSVPTSPYEEDFRALLRNSVIGNLVMLLLLTSRPPWLLFEVVIRKK